MITGPYPEPKEPEHAQYLREDEVRDLVAERFASEEVYFEEDVRYSMEGVEFVVDGFNEDLGIGYEYFSYEDLGQLAERGDGEAWDREFLDEVERGILERTRQEGGDCILVFESGGTFSAMEERTMVGTVLEEFLVELKASGRL